MTVKFIIYVLYFNELISNMFFFSVVSTTCQDEGEPQGSHLHFLMMGEGGTGSEWFFWVWKFGQKWFFLGLWLGREKNQKDFYGMQKKDFRRFFLGMLKKVVIFLGRQILKLWFFGVKNINLCPPPPRH